MMKRIAVLIVCSLPVGALAAELKKTFEVASVKPSAPPGGSAGMVRMMMGSRFGPGTADPTRWACDNCPVSMLLTQAYNLKRFQITGPAWMDNERFDIAARVAEGATKDDLRLMQKSLLEERFGLKARLELKEMQVMELVVAKNGPKFKESTTTPADPSKPLGMGGGPLQMKMGADGFPDLPKDRTMTFVMNGNAKHQAVAEDMTQFVAFLSAQLDKPVTDSTGLTAKYDYTMTYAAIAGRGPGGGGGGGGGPMMMMMMTRGPGPGGPGGPGAGPGGGDHSPIEGVDVEAAPPLQKAVQDQLGLRLEAKKGMADMLFIDQLEKVPTEN